MYQKLLETCTDTELRVKATRDLMYCCYTRGRTDLARTYADQLPPFAVCREYNLGRGNCLEGRELAEYLKANIRLYGEAMIECLGYFEDPVILTEKEKFPLTAERAREKTTLIKKVIEE